MVVGGGGYPGLAAIEEVDDEESVVGEEVEGNAPKPKRRKVGFALPISPPAV